MSLIRCAECKAKVSDKAASCPKCGAPIEISKKKQGRLLSTGCGYFIGMLIVCGLFIAVLLENNQEIDHPSAPSTDFTELGNNDIGLLPGVRIFLNTHDEFGTPTATQAIPDWAQGKRQSVVLSNGRILLFYLQGDKVVTIYEQDGKGGREKVWGGYSEGAEYMKDVPRQATNDIPEYKIISAINLNIGGKSADVLIPRLTRETSREERMRIAHAILKKEGLREICMFSTIDAQKAAYSSSFANANPNAKQGFLGAIDKDSGKFYD